MPKLILPNGAIIESDNANDFLPFVEKKAKAVTNDGEPKHKRRYTKSRIGHAKWSGEEIDLVAQNLNRTTAELMRMMPGRTSKAIEAIKYQLRHNRLSAGKAKVYAAFLGDR
jgi:hypothetical protein